MELLLGWLSLGFQRGKRTIPYSHRYAKRPTGSHVGRTLPTEPGTARDPSPRWRQSTEQVTGEWQGGHKRGAGCSQVRGRLLTGVHNYPPWALRVAGTPSSPAITGFFHPPHHAIKMW